MAEVVPTRGLLYDPARAGPLDALVAPPYDVVSETERSALAAKSPYNIVRVDLPQGDPERKYGNDLKAKSSDSRDDVCHALNKTCLGATARPSACRVNVRPCS